MTSRNWMVLGREMTSLSDGRRSRERGRGRGEQGAAPSPDSIRSPSTIISTDINTPRRPRTYSPRPSQMSTQGGADAKFFSESPFSPSHPYPDGFPPNLARLSLLSPSGPELTISLLIQHLDVTRSVSVECSSREDPGATDGAPAVWRWVR
jgi:hypothetical protein